MLTEVGPGWARPCAVPLAEQEAIRTSIARLEVVADDPRVSAYLRGAARGEAKTLAADLAARLEGRQLERWRPT